MSNNPNDPSVTSNQQQQQQGEDPDAEVIALSPKTLLATNRFVCEICNKGFQRDQNLQLHRRGHNLPWKLRQRSGKEPPRKRVYVCPETSCVHHNPSRALGDLTGIKKHFCRKHGEKKWKCDKCSKRYAVQSDWKAHSKTCGTREYRCDCGTLFSRRDSFITHRAFCDALAQETARIHHHNLVAPPPLSLWGGDAATLNTTIASAAAVHQLPPAVQQMSSSSYDLLAPPFDMGWQMYGNNNANNKLSFSASCSELTSASKDSPDSVVAPSLFSNQHQQHLAAKPAADMSATALLQKAAQIGAVVSSPNNNSSSMPSQVLDGLLFAHHHNATSLGNLPPYHSGLNKGREETRDFLGVALSCSSSLHGWI
ncbi:hypothetical protein EJB05_32814, partial [Eragrostis curvula]